MVWFFKQNQKGRGLSYPLEAGILFSCISFMQVPKQVWTIGHSTRTLEEFLKMLDSFQIKTVADIRTYPGSRRYPHFNKELLSTSLIVQGLKYTHIPELGGRRKPRADSTNTVWRNMAFRGYADYMETEEFRKGISQLENLAQEENVAYMCSEAVWWRCHRALVSDFLKNRGWTVYHIMSASKIEEHPFTAPAREAQGKLF
jgi:uncharacterized protein (DUF488 family)